MLFAKKEFELSASQPDGASLREHLESVWRQTGNRPIELELPEFPETLVLVWRYFLELSNARTSSGFGANPITFSEIQAWNELTGAEVTAKEVSIIKQLDNVFMSHQAEQQKSK